MKKTILSLMSCSVLFLTFSQDLNNLVENGSFEQLEGKIKKAGAIDIAVGWMSPTKTGADLYSSSVKEGFSVPDNGYGREDAYDGKNYIGIKTFSYGDKEPRTYISTKLRSIMRKDMKYCVKFYVSLAEASKFASNNIAVNFSKKQYNIAEDKSIITDSHIMQRENKIFNATFGWDQVCGVYTAEGGEKFITIGNFTASTNTKNERLKKPKDFTGAQLNSAYYYMDNISVTFIEDEDECICDRVEEEVTSILYAVTPVNPEGLKDEMIIKYSVVYFHQFKHSIEESAKGHLENVLAVMEHDAKYKLTIVSHLDETEAAEEDSDLDVLRAEAVKKYLVGEGISADRITIEYKKYTVPSSTSSTDEMQAKNRRIEFILK